MALDIAQCKECYYADEDGVCEKSCVDNAAFEPKRPNERIIEWISVKDRLPEDQEEVLVCTRSKNGVRNIDKGYWAIDRFIHRGCAEVTHWMPLPVFPKEKGE